MLLESLQYIAIGSAVLDSCLGLGYEKLMIGWVIGHGVPSRREREHLTGSPESLRFAATLVSVQCAIPFQSGYWFLKTQIHEAGAATPAFVVLGHFTI